MISPSIAQSAGPETAFSVAREQSLDKTKTVNFSRNLELVQTDLGIFPKIVRIPVNLFV